MPTLSQLLMVLIAPFIIHLAVITVGPWRPAPKGALAKPLGRVALKYLWGLMLFNGLMIATTWAAFGRFGFFAALVPFAMLLFPAGLQGVVAWESFKQTYLRG